jgi:hypothetical protein
MDFVSIDLRVRGGFAFATRGAAPAYFIIILLLAGLLLVSARRAAVFVISFLAVDQVLLKD